MKLWMFALAGALLCASNPALAQPAAAAAKTVQLSKVILDTETTPVKGKLKGGTLCVFPQEIKLTREKKTQDYERFDSLFAEKMKASGFTIMTTSGDLFAGEGDKNKGDILIGAVMRPDTLNICSSVNGFKGNMILIVDWQVYDRATQSVIASVTTTGQSMQEKFAPDGMLAMWNGAFVANLGALIDQGVVQKHIGMAAAPPAPAPTPPAAASAD